MPNYFSKPENALTRAEELIKVDKKQSALEVLSDVMKSKKHRNWQKIHEDIMMLFVRLCVELKKSVQFKEVIHQYKNIVLQVNPKTLEDVVRHYLDLAKTKTEEARQESAQSVTDVDDLDVIQTPEKLILSAVTGEGPQDRSDRTILTPWLKFLWESYRQCLDLLRNNSKFERLYHEVAAQTYEFCLKYGRKTEFRKLCDILRHHLTKFQNQTANNVPPNQSGVNLNNPETQGFHLDTRLKQLDHAMELELYMEAFKAVEDIWSLVSLSKKPPKPSLMANYYKKTAVVFLKSGSQLFHAAALHKLFLLIREQKRSLSQEELQFLASRVLCATLAIPLTTVRQNTDTLLECGEISSVVKQKTLANLLGIAIPPTRQSLVRDLVRHNIPALVFPELGKLYQYVDVDFHPLKIAERTAPAMTFIKENEDLAIYSDLLEHVLISKTILQVAQVYQSMGFPQFCQLCPYADTLRLERTLVTLIRNLELPIRLDHRRDALLFHAYSDLGISQRENSPLAGSGGGPEQLASQMVTLCQSLQKVLEIIKPPEDSQVAECRRYTVQAYRNSAQATHAKNLQRKVIIEARKEALERMAEEKEMEEESKRALELRKQSQLEESRLAQEADERERQRMEDEKQRLKQKINKERYNIMKATDVGAKALENFTEEQVAELDPVELFQLQLRQAAKQAQETQERARAQERKFDYLTRAMRLEEMGLWTKAYEDERQVAIKRHAHHEVEKVELSKNEHARQLADKDRLSRLKTDVQILMKKLNEKRDANHQDKIKEFETMKKNKKQERLDERKRIRKEERKAVYLKEKQERLEREEEEKRKAAEAAEAIRLEKESQKFRPSALRDRDNASTGRGEDKEGGSWRGAKESDSRRAPADRAEPSSQPWKPSFTDKKATEDGGTAPSSGVWRPRVLQDRDRGLGSRDEPVRRGDRMDDRRPEPSGSTPWRRGGGRSGYMERSDDDRGGRFERGGGRLDRDSDDRPKPGGRFERDDRDDRPRGGRFEREDRDDRPRTGRFERDERDDRPKAGRFERDDRDDRPRAGGRFDRDSPRSGGRFDRDGDDRPKGRFDRDQEDRGGRFDRGGGEDLWRRQGPPREDRDRRDDRGGRLDDRGGRGQPERSEGGWRSGRSTRDDDTPRRSTREPLRNEKKEEQDEDTDDGWMTVNKKR